MTNIQLWTLVFVIITFSVYIYIAYASRVNSTAGFYVAGGGIPAPANGAAIAADWMSAASFISMAGIIALSANG
jgi:cation/acetate symporter